MKRREFLQSSVAVAASATLPRLAVAAEESSGKEKGADKPLVKQYRPLGKTAIRMSDISFGAGKLPSASMILRAIDQGIRGESARGTVDIGVGIDAALGGDRRATGREREGQGAVVGCA